MSYSSPAKKASYLNQSGFSTTYSPTKTSLRKNDGDQTFSSTHMGSPMRNSSAVEVDHLINERNHFKTSFHQAEIELMRTQQEVRNLEDQLDYYKSRALASPTRSAYQRDLEASVASPIRNRDRTVKEEALEAELSRLRKQLIEKSQQVEDWMKRATKAEVLASGDINIPEELLAKQQEIERLNRELTSLQLKSQDVGKLEREIQDLRGLLDFKEEENEKLRQEKTALQLESYKAKQSELSLKDTEVKLNVQVKHLQNHLEETQKESENILKVKEHIHEEKVKELEQTAKLEKSMLQRDLETVENLLNHKSQQLTAAEREKLEKERELLRTKTEAQMQERSASQWRERATSAEKEIVYVKEKSVVEKEQLRQQMKKDHSIERMVLEDKIKTLQNIVTRKESELQNTQLSLVDTNQKKRELELARLRLQGAVEDLEKQNTVTVQQYETQLQVKENVHQQQVNNLKSSHHLEKTRLNRNVDTLNYLNDKTRQERDLERSNALQYQREYLRSAEKHRRAENEANYWQTHSNVVERQKDEELRRADDLRRSQVDNLNRLHSREIVQKNLENESLVRSVVVKDREVNDLRSSNIQARAEALQKQREAEEASISASLWRSKHAEEQNKRHVDNLVNEDLRRSQNLKNDLELSTTKQVYNSEIKNLNDMIDRKSDEAQDWRNNYHRVLRSKY